MTDDFVPFDLDSDDLGEGTLTEIERAAVEWAVNAVVAHDDEAIGVLTARLGPTDIYEWCRDYGEWEEVTLTVPPGPSTQWRGGVMRWKDKPDWVAVRIDMWTAQEGESDLTVELELERLPSGAVLPHFENLHVM